MPRLDQPPVEESESRIWVANRSWKDQRTVSRPGSLRILEALAAVILIAGIVFAGYPLWFLIAISVFGTFALVVESWVLVRRAFWIALISSYLALVTDTVFPFSWGFRWACCLVMTGAVNFLLYWAVDE
jgi:hypothetical protein